MNTIDYRYEGRNLEVNYKVYRSDSMVDFGNVYLMHKGKKRRINMKESFYCQIEEKILNHDI
jgi:hypothetical protein